MTSLFSQSIFLGGVAIMICIFLPTGESISCYQCNSRNDTGCEDLKKEDVWSRYYLPCPEEGLQQYTFCRKLVQYIKIKGLEHTRTIRKCGFAKHTKPCYKNTDDDHEEIICQCFEDGCNSSTSLFPALSVTIITSIWRILF